MHEREGDIHRKRGEMKGERREQRQIHQKPQRNVLINSGRVLWSLMHRKLGNAQESPHLMTQRSAA